MAIIIKPERIIIVVVKSNAVLLISMPPFYYFPDMLDVYLVCIFFILVISKWHTNFLGASHPFFIRENSKVREYLAAWKTSLAIKFDVHPPH